MILFKYYSKVNEMQNKIKKEMIFIVHVNQKKNFHVKTRGKFSLIQRKGQK